MEQLLPSCHPSVFDINCGCLPSRKGQPKGGCPLSCSMRWRQSEEVSLQRSVSCTNSQARRICCHRHCAYIHRDINLIICQHLTGIYLTIVVDNDITTRVVIKRAGDFGFFSLRAHKCHKMILKEAIYVHLLARRSPHDMNSLVTSLLSRFRCFMITVFPRRG